MWNIQVAWHVWWSAPEEFDIFALPVMPMESTVDVGLVIGSGSSAFGVERQMRTMFCERRYIVKQCSLRWVLFTVMAHTVHYSLGTVAINLSHTFLIKRLRERKRHRHCLPLPFHAEGRGSEPLVISMMWCDSISVHVEFSSVILLFQSIHFFWTNRSIMNPGEVLGDYCSGWAC
jgi:hypothetical protein